LNILFPFVGDSVGGSHISTLILVDSLNKQGVRTFIVIHEDNGPLANYLNKKNIPFNVLKSSKLAGESPGKLSIFISILKNFFIFRSYILENKIDIVHGNDLRINLSWSIPAKFSSKAFVWHQRTLLSKSNYWLLIKYLCNYFLAISEVVFQNAPQNIKITQKNVVYNPFEIDLSINKSKERKDLIEKCNLPSDSILLGCVGRIVGYKNIDFLIKSLFNIRKKINKNFYLIIVGNGSDDYISELKSYARSFSVEEYIRFTGFTHSPNTIIASVDLLIAPSYIDAFGRSIVEAMIQKTPVLAANVGGHIEIINDGFNGKLYEPKNENDFTDKIIEIFSEDNLNVISDDAHKYAVLNFSPEKHLENIMPIYQNLIKG
jgi:glycosyltransferase involved in cell wall biosynthesis